MQTNDLIKQLAENAAPVASSTMRNQMALVFGAGAAAAIALQVMTVGIRGDIGIAWAAVVLKLLFCLSVAFVWVHYLRSAISPAMRLDGRFVISIVVLALIALVATFAPLDLAGLQGCVSQVMVLSLPALFGFMWVARRGAPMHAAFTGFAVGIVAGALGTFGYAFGCLTDEPATNALRYGSAMLATGFLGLVVGRFMLRW